MTETPLPVDGLFESFAVKSLRLRNRFAMAPMTRAFSPGGVPGDDVAAYYRRRAAGGVGLVITEGTYIPDPAAGSHTRVPRLYGPDSLAGWTSVVDAVHDEGGQIIPQLWHLGVERGPRPRLNPDVTTASPSGIALDGTRLGREFTESDLDALRESWVAAAVNARDVGFDGIELHGAHGYLLDQFLWDRTNVRSDGYGGSLEDRTRFPAEVVAAIRQAVGEDFAIVYRFSQWKSNHYDSRIAQSPDELAAVLAPLVAAGVDVLHPSTRRHWEPAFAELAGEDGELGLAGWTKRLTDYPPSRSVRWASTRCSRRPSPRTARRTPPVSTACSGSTRTANSISSRWVARCCPIPSGCSNSATAEPPSTSRSRTSTGGPALTVPVSCPRR